MLRFRGFGVWGLIKCSASKLDCHFMYRLKETSAMRRATEMV